MLDGKLTCIEHATTLQKPFSHVCVSFAVTGSESVCPILLHRDLSDIAARCLRKVVEREGERGRSVK